MVYNIYFWHGFTQRLAKTLEERTHYFQDQTCLDQPRHGEYEWRGSLDLFKEQYQDKFIVMGETICITQYSNFGQR